MKKFFKLFLSLIFYITLSAQENKEIVISNLQASCSIKIIQRQLESIHSKNTDTHEFHIALKKLYEECSAAINPSGLPHITKDDWIQKTIQETTNLQNDHVTIDCFDQAISQLKQSDEPLIQGNSFFQSAQKCFNLSHLNTAIQRWEHDPIKDACQNKLWAILLKSSHDETYNLKQDLYQAYLSCPLTEKIPFEESIKKTQPMLKILKKNPQAVTCLESLLQFKEAYKNALTQEKKDTLKKDFATPYMQCKNQ